MPIQTIKITNAAGFQSYETALPAITLIQGKNKKGKSALLSCIMYPHDSGHEPDMYSPFTDEPGEIIQTMDDGTMIRARITKDGTERFTKPKDGKSWKKGRALIDEMSNAITYAPLRLMDLSEKELLDAVLKVMPLETKPGELEAALGELASPELLAITASNALEQIGDERSGIYAAIYGKRRAVNSEADGLTKHAEQLLKTMPPAAPDGSDWEGEVVRFSAYLKEKESTLRTNLNNIKTVFDEQRKATVEYRDFMIAQASEKRDARLLVVQREYDQEKEAAQFECTDAIEAASKKTQGLIDELRAAHAPEADVLKSNLATAQERARASIEAKTTQANANSAKQEAASKLDQSKAMTAALGRLQSLKQAIASRLSIKGVTFQEGRLGRIEKGIFVPFQKWNRSGRMAFCLKIGMLANKAGFIVIDDTEAWDAENRKALQKAIVEYQEEKGVQFVVASVGDGELVVLDGREA